MMYHPQTILSENRKTNASLDLPIKGHCRPTKNCAHDCYAKSGPQAYPHSQKKHEWVSKYLLRKNISELIQECKNKLSVRLNGSGDLLKDHIPNILHLAKACPQTIFWGMTRKPEIATAVNSSNLPNLRLLLSVDASSPKSVWNYKGKMCYGPHRPGDLVPNTDQILTVFPRHFIGKVIKGIPEHPKDCPAVRHKISECINCKRCWNW
jgi:hypothetical protein